MKLAGFGIGLRLFRPATMLAKALAAPPAGMLAKALGTLLAKALAALLATMLLLAGCTPEFNWREVRIEPGTLRVLMPSKAEQLTRTVPLGEEALVMHMTGARVAALSFTVTVVELGSAREDVAAQALVRMEQAMLRNIDGRMLERAEILLAPATPALALRAQGKAQGKPVMMWARFFRWKDFAVQAVVIGSEADSDKAETFFESLRIAP